MMVGEWNAAVQRIELDGSGCGRDSRPSLGAKWPVPSLTLESAATRIAAACRDAYVITPDTFTSNAINHKNKS